MLFLLFQLGSERYAIEAHSAVEVVPLLALKRIPQAPPGVAGIFNYRGRPVPAIDLCALTLGRPAREQLSTRIIILRSESRAPAAMDAEPGTRSPKPRLVGVIAERATELLRKEVSGAQGQVSGPDTAHRAPDAVGGTPARVSAAVAGEFLGPVLMDEKGFLQLVRPEHLLPEAVWEALFAQVESFSYEAD